MNMNEEYLDNLLKNMNNASATPEEPREEEGSFRAPEADLRPAKEDKAGSSLTPEEIAALFDAAEKIANGEEPESLSDESEDSPVSTPEETTTEDSPVSKPEEMTPEDSPVSAPEETTPENSPESAPEDSPVFMPEEMTPEDSPVFMPEATGPDDGDTFKVGTGTSDNAGNLMDEAPEKQPESAPEMLTLPEDMEKELQELQRLTEENEIPTEASYEEKPTAGQETEASTGGDVLEMDPADIDELLQDKSDKKEKKPGFFKRLLAFFTEEATPEEEPQKDENEEVLAELDKEDKTAEQDKKKKKKDKPAKGKGAKKNAKAGNAEDGDEEEDGKPEKGKGKGKTKKTPKKKKEKPEVPEQEEKVSKGYTKKNIILVCLFSAAVFAVLYLSISYVAPGYAKKNAVTAFENQDYLTCYEILYGQKLTEREQQLFTFSNMVLRMQKKINDYDKYVEDGENLYALDSLMQAVEEYEETQGEALACGADGEMLKLYREVLTILQENYGLDEEGVRGIAFCDNKVEYTRMLDTLINGGTVDIKEEPATDTEDLPDLLPEEEETDDTEFLPEDVPDTEILPEDAGNPAGEPLPEDTGNTL